MIHFLRSVKMVCKRKLDLFRYLPELFSPQGHIYVSYAIVPGHTFNYNWGDDVNKVLVELISGKKVIPYHCAWIPQKNILCIGSILQWYSNKNAVIWGAGLREVNKITPPNLILAVRGPLTRKVLIDQGLQCPEIYGDPALLFPRFFQPIVTKEYAIGIVCHYTERTSVMENLSDYKNAGIHFIDVRKYGKWEKFIEEICKCETILSSSLHGCIIADAYAVPNLWSQFTDYIAEGDGFKFHDYYLSTARNIKSPVKISYLPDGYEMAKTLWLPPEIDLDLLMQVCPFVKS